MKSWMDVICARWEICIYVCMYVWMYRPVQVLYLRTPPDPPTTVDQREPGRAAAQGETRGERWSVCRPALGYGR